MSVDVTPEEVTGATIDAERAQSAIENILAFMVADKKLEQEAFDMVMEHLEVITYKTFTLAKLIRQELDDGSEDGGPWVLALDMGHST